MKSSRETWLGSDPSDPEVCLRKVGGRPQQRLLYGVWLLPISGEDDYRLGVRQAFSAASHETCFDKLDRPTNSPRNAQPVNYHTCISGRGMMDWPSSEGPSRVFVLLVSSHGNN